MGAGAPVGWTTCRLANAAGAGKARSAGGRGAAGSARGYICSGTNTADTRESGGTGGCGVAGTSLGNVGLSTYATDTREAGSAKIIGRVTCLTSRKICPATNTSAAGQAGRTGGRGATSTANCYIGLCTHPTRTRQTGRAKIIRITGLTSSEIGPATNTRITGQARGARGRGTAGAPQGNVGAHAEIALAGTGSART